MAATKLSPEEKQRNDKRRALNNLCISLTSAFSFKGQTAWTWATVYKYTSVPPNTPPEKLKEVVTYPALKEYVQSLKDSLEASFKNIAPRQEVSAAPKPKPAPAPNPFVVREPTPKFDITLTESTEPEEEVDMTKPTVDNDYLLPPSSREQKSMIKYWHQRKAAKEILDNIFVHDARGQQLIAAAGYGKTFIIGAVTCRLEDRKFCDDKTFGSTKILYVTKNTVVEQTRRVFEKMFKLTMFDGFEVINYESLRSKAGQLWVKEECKIVNGEEVITWKWRPMLNPVIIIWDENQSLKNPGSIQHQVASEVNNIATPVYQIFVSATPYTRVSEAKCFAVSTHKDITDIIGIPAKLSNSTWPTYAKFMAKDSSPEDYNEAAVERLTKDLERYIVRVRGVKPQFKAINRVKMIKFESKEERDYYNDTEERYFREKAKLEQDAAAGLETNVGLLHLVLLTKRAVAAEFCRRRQFAKYMYDVVKSGKAAACAVKYKTTLIPIVKILIEEYGVTRDQISLVWGGGQTQLTKKQKVKADIKRKAAALEAMGVSAEEMMKDLDLEDVEDRVLEELPAEFRLGGQTKEERQREIDKFQSGKTLYCIYTFKAGGVGLSLHHSDELTEDWDRSVPGFNEWYARMQKLHPKNRPAPGKVRRQKTGFAVEEDIKFIPVRQRQTCLSVAYSAIDMVQSTGRVPRLTSLSDTEQDCILYQDTVEVDIAHVYSSKLKCLSKVVRTHESWVDLIVGSDRERIVAEHIKDDAEYAASQGEDVGDISTEEDDE